MALMKELHGASTIQLLNIVVVTINSQLHVTLRHKINLSILIGYRSGSSGSPASSPHLNHFMHS